MNRTDVTRRDAVAFISAASMTIAVPARAIATPEPWTATGDVAFGGGRLHFASCGQGDGPPLILLPKLGGWIADWRLAAPALAARRRVIAFDPPGHGDSIMAGPPPYVMTMPECAAILLGVLDQMGIDRFSVAGNSMGGIIGVLLAALWPSRIDRLVVVSSSMIGPMSFDQLRAQDAANADKERLAAMGRGLTPEQERTRLFATIDPRITEEQIAGRAKAGGWLRPCERGVGRVGVTDYLQRIAAPTLLINSDRGAYAKYAEVGSRLIPHVRTVTVSGSGAFVHQERPAEVAGAMNAFLDGASR